MPEQPRQLEQQYAPESNRLEQYAARYLRKRLGGEQDAVSGLAAQDVQQLIHLQRRAVIWAALAGAISGGILGLGEVILRQYFIGDAEAASWSDQIPHWTVYGIIALIVSAIEILFLYWNALNGTSRLAHMTGLPQDARGEIIVRGLARAALEFPNPRAPIYGVDPYARTPRWKLLAWAAMYRMKVGVTSFILRVLLRRMLGRAALRTVIPLVAGPLYAFWNGIITYRIIRAARMRAFGLHAIDALARRLLAEREQWSEAAKRLTLEAVAESIMRSEDAHPNYALLLARLARDLDIAPQDMRCDWKRAVRELAQLEPHEQDAVLEVLALATVLDGRIRRRDRALLAQAHTACGRGFRPERLRYLREQILRGQGGADQRLTAVWAGA